MYDVARHIAELRTKAMMNFYAAERRNGVDPDTAHARAEEFMARFNVLTVMEASNERAA